ncbi:MAG TPA: NADH-quinone oxidoreductase subunit M [Candidatus Saccharimonadales bacterium]|nr:NADH-quinone oxidoreductase subunit M [Candidatus Saccharimonadales bacterium]
MVFKGILSLICYLPLAGALLVLLFPKDKKGAIAKFATLVMLADFIVSLPLFLTWNRALAGFDPVTLEEASWIPAIGVKYIFGVDGISMLLVMLTTLLGFIGALSSWTAIKDRVKEYYIFLLLLQTGMLGVFMSLDMFLFYVFWEVMLVPMYFLIGIWGSHNRLYAAIKFFLYTLLGSVLMLLGILAIYFYNGATTFDVREFHRLALDPGWTLPVQTWIFWAFFVGFAIKVPMFPFHTWLPDAHTEAPTAGSVILAGVLLKMGTYGFVRFSLPILPDATWKFLPWMLGLCVVGIIYGAMVAMVQKDWKKLVAYSSVSHLGFCMLGVFALNVNGLNGGILQMINHGISTGALFLIVGLVYERRHTRLIAEYGGLSKVMPIFATLFMIMMLSSIGLPALNGFIGEFTILAGAFQIPSQVGFTLFGTHFGGMFWAICAVFGIVLGAAYMLWLYQRTMWGKLENPENQGLKDLNVREIATLVPLVVMAFWIGLYPKPFFGILERPVARLVEQVHHRWDGNEGEAIAAAPATAAEVARAVARTGTEGSGERISGPDEATGQVER